VIICRDRIGLNQTASHHRKRRRRRAAHEVNLPAEQVLQRGCRPSVRDELPTGGARHLLQFDTTQVLIASLAIYRMVFGQSRQEDPITYLVAKLPEGERDKIVAELQIDLSPASWKQRPLEDS
jgi:hypothetical protein